MDRHHCPQKTTIKISSACTIPNIARYITDIIKISCMNSASLINQRNLNWSTMSTILWIINKFTTNRRMCVNIIVQFVEVTQCRQVNGQNLLKREAYESVRRTITLTGLFLNLVVTGDII
jgi:hypothetical protein